MGCFTPLFSSVSWYETNWEVHSSSAPPPQPPLPLPGSTAAPFNPAIVVAVGTLTTIFSITSLVLLYAKHCRSGSSNSSYRVPPPVVSREYSGIGRQVIESLPLFRFSSLRGQKDVLECTVCLDKFKPDEILRLLPRCKHAFHVECVDTWLEEHSSCPLCRCRVHLEDILLEYGDQKSRSLSGYNQSDQEKGKEMLKSRITGRHSSAGEGGSSLEISVENPGDNSSRGRFSLDSSSYRKMPVSLARRSPWFESFSRKDTQLAVQEDRHRLDHRIILSGSGKEEEEEEV